MKWLALVALTITTSVFANCWYPYLEGYGRYGDYRQGGSAHAFVPATLSNYSLFFAEGRAGQLHHQTTAGVGAGYRRIACPCFAFGLAAFADWARTDHGHNYYQATLSGEIFYECWDLSINGYLPNTTRHIENDQVLERAYTGLDVNAGYNVELGWGRIRGWAGYFYYGSGVLKDIRGPRFRLHVEKDDIFCWNGARAILGAEWQYDTVRGKQGALLAGIRIPLCRQRQPLRCCSGFYQRMGNLVLRDIGVVFGRKDLPQ